MLRIRSALRNERGATAVEYSIMVFLIAAVIVISVASLGNATNSSLDCTGKSWQTKTTSCVSSSATDAPSSGSSTTPSSSPTSGGSGQAGNGGVGQGSGNGNAKH